ncbi:MAG: glutathione synthase [Pseudomonadota bacterium]
MDPIASITPTKDSTLAMMLAVQSAGDRVWVMEQKDLYMQAGEARAQATAVVVQDTHADWFRISETRDRSLADFATILMRKDPPFDMEFIYTTYLLELAEAAGTPVINKPAALRDLNEKMATALFPALTPATLVTRSQDQLRTFLATHHHIVVKPLDGMGGRSIFTLQAGDKNANVVFETLTEYGTQFAMAQVYVPEITDGDKRVLMIDGTPVEYMLARVPDAADGRGNLVMGARADARPLGEVERRIAETVGPLLRERGVLFAGLDVIGDRLTEINVTSPTGIREIDRHFDVRIAERLYAAVVAKLT